MKALKTLARRRRVAVIALNQFTQEGNRGGKPTMHDMLGGSAVVNDSDTVILMHTDDAIGNTVLPTEILVPKSRSSRTGVVETKFFRDRGEFVEVERVHEKERQSSPDLDMPEDVEDEPSGARGGLAKVLPMHEATGTGGNR